MERYNLKDYFDEEEGFNENWQNQRASFNYSKHFLIFKILKAMKDKFVLSLGCGVGREVKILIANGNKVVGVDLAEKVVKSSKKLEPNAEYHCIGAEDYLDNKKFDYILSLVGVLNYIITKEKRERLAKNMKQMLKKNGEIIVSLNLINLKEGLKLIVAPLIALVFGEYKDYSFGDIYYHKLNDKGERIYFVKTHLYTKKELKSLFENMNLEFIKEKNRTYIIRIKWKKY